MRWVGAFEEVYFECELKVSAIDALEGVVSFIRGRRTWEAA